MTRLIAPPQWVVCQGTSVGHPSSSANLHSSDSRSGNCHACHDQHELLLSDVVSARHFREAEQACTVQTQQHANFCHACPGHMHSQAPHGHFPVKLAPSSLMQSLWGTWTQCRPAKFRPPIRHVLVRPATTSLIASVRHCFCQVVSAGDSGTA